MAKRGPERGEPGLKQVVAKESGRRSPPTDSRATRDSPIQFQPATRLNDSVVACRDLIRHRFHHPVNRARILPTYVGRLVPHCSHASAAHAGPLWVVSASRWSSLEFPLTGSTGQSLAVDGRRLPGHHCCSEGLPLGAAMRPERSFGTR